VNVAMMRLMVLGLLFRVFYTKLATPSVHAEYYVPSLMQQVQEVSKSCKKVI
jgi:hypothetical protein